MISGESENQGGGRYGEGGLPHRTRIAHRGAPGQQAPFGETFTPIETLPPHLLYGFLSFQSEEQQVRGRLESRIKELESEVTSDVSSTQTLVSTLILIGGEERERAEGRGDEHHERAGSGAV